MYLDQLILNSKRGKPSGIPSICSANPWVLKACLSSGHTPLLVESTCNQVNQYGGYTGQTPQDFVDYFRKLAAEYGYPLEQIIFGGDHLGPSVWQDEAAETAMDKSEVMIREYVRAGYTKIHLDCSMRLGDDPEGALDPVVSARRAARLARTAESVGGADLRYVIGTEVPVPGGATEKEDGVAVTGTDSLQQTIDTTREAFAFEGLDDAWGRVIAVVVQPGVEFGDDFVLTYQPEKARELSRFMDAVPMVFEAHSTDYQSRGSLSELVRDGFAILKVGPALTYAFREAVFGLARIESERLIPETKSHLISLIDKVMVESPKHWEKYYHGTEEDVAYKRVHSYSDRIRYYWSDPRVERALKRMLENLHEEGVPSDLMKKYLPDVCREMDGLLNPTPEQVIQARINLVLDDYHAACG